MACLVLAAALSVGCQRSSSPGVGLEPGERQGSTKSSLGEAAQSHGTGSPSRPHGTASSSAPAPPPEPPFTSTDSFDLLIAGGTVVDGSGGPGRLADVLIDGDQIVHVGRVDSAVKVARRIQAAGQVVAPGFIDIHSHGDPVAANRNSLAMGVTVICVGQDGRSPSGDRLAYWIPRIGRKRLALNVVPYVGHGTVRGLAKVGLRADLTDKQLARMARIVERDLAAGAWGLTTALEYRPGVFASAAELTAIAKPVAAVDGVVMSHLRSEDDDKIDEAIDELIAQGSSAGARVHVSHIKVVYGKGAARAERLLAKLQAARDQGTPITADIYPYNASYTGISIVFPAFALPPNSYQRVKRNRRDELADYLRKRVTQRGGPEATLFGTPPYRGKTLAEVAKKKGKPFEDVLIDDIGPGGVSAAYFVMDDALQSRLLIDPQIAIGTDGGSSSRHPRGYGAFAKVIAEHVIKRQALSIEQAVRKMTGLPAAIVGLDDHQRGLLRAGWAADVVIFDPAAVTDRATYEAPNRLSQGMSWVLVNGQAVVEEGRFTKRRPGRLLIRK